LRGVVERVLLIHEARLEGLAGMETT
jgi:hypothetical protein